MENNLNIRTGTDKSSLLKTSVAATSSSQNISHFQNSKALELPHIEKNKVNLLQTIKFNIIEGAEDLAQVKLVLCNLSQASLKFRLKSNQNDAVTCRVNSFGIIKEKENHEVLLSWYRFPEYKTWIDVPPLKMIIESCLNSKNLEEEEESKTAIRFLGAVSTAEPCRPENIPTEQLLLDSRLGNLSEKTRREKNNINSKIKLSNKANEEQEELKNNMLYLLFFLVILLFINYGFARK